MQKYLMGIDRGTTNVKAGLYDPDGTEVFVYSQPCEEVRSPCEGYAEQNMDRMWLDTVKAVRGVWDQGYRPEDLMAVGLSGQGGGLFLIDEHNRPVREGIVSLDSRVAYAAKVWRQEHSHEKFLELFNNGNPTLPQALLYWLKEEEPKQYKKSKWVLQCKDWIRFMLTGNVNYEITDASNGFLIDQACAYRMDTFADYGIPEAGEKFPPLLRPWEPAGTVTKEAAHMTGLVPGTLVAAGGHDVAMAALGSGCIRPGEMVCVLGTWGLNLMNIRQPHLMMEHYGKVILSAVPDLYLFMNGGSTGMSLDWFTEQFCTEEKAIAKKQGISVFEVIEEKIKNGADESRSQVICHPYTEPLLMMPGYENARAGFYGMTGQTTKGQLLRAILEGIAIEIALFLQVSAKAAGNLDGIYLTGGGARNRLLAQMIADAAKLKVRIADIAESGCRGAALTAGIAAGVYADHGDMENLPVHIKEEFKPDADGMNYMEEKLRQSGRIARVMEEIWEK